MRVIEVISDSGSYILQYKDHWFEVIRKSEDGQQFFYPVCGWGELSRMTNLATETLMDLVDEVCWNCEYLIEEKND
jgi:hypothetical protein